MKRPGALAVLCLLLAGVPVFAADAATALAAEQACTSQTANRVLVRWPCLP